MQLKSISWRNIGPYGNKLQTLDFSEAGGLWMVTGKNGNGKSFVVNLPKILYYGKLDGFKKDEIANRLNKHGWISGEIQTSPGQLVTIERKMSPSSLDVFKYKVGEEPNEDNNIGKAGIKNYQDYIDLEVTGLPYHIFSNIISLSVNDFKSFISMTPSDKRIIIDKLFAMEVINKMHDLIRKDLKQVKIDIALFDREILSLNFSVENAIKELTRLKERVETNNEKRIAEIVTKMKTYEPKVQEAYNKLKEFKAKHKEVQTAKESFTSQKRTISSELSILKKKENLFNQDKCPTCESSFSDKKFELVKGEIKENVKTREQSLKELLEKAINYDVLLAKIAEGDGKLTNFIIQVQSAYKALEAELASIRKDKKPEEFTAIRNIIKKNTISVKNKEDSKVVLDDNHSYLAILQDLYSDSGVKKKILESYLPTLNKEIEFTLNELHFPYSLEFNSDFEPIMGQLGIDISVDTLSTGEKKRVDLAVLISIIRMLKRKYHLLNIFMLDEVLSSIDGDGIYDIIGLLQRTAKELKMNIFIINHSPLPVEYFSYKMDVQKNAGFSDLVIEKLEEDGDDEL